ncbi:tRNA-dihydrouridine synthase [Vogesella sp. LIG4]|uniref:tRNA dihydrouridine synthase n=1 Tax=Vogesella sp. LIG4 TaxID=1192162 RepID=UPI000820065A|nr:tRNA-dihydrouridine synthase [Vogesella sp. LIG4]SCK25853.1 tRNA-U20a,U20b-dihydrouridine synthase [Vogesella sp. LIG4]
MKIVLAPMEGLVDDIMRDVLTRIGGIDLCVTEFVRVTSSLLPTRTFQRLAPELANDSHTRSGTPLRVQLLGSDIEFLAANAVRAAELGAAAVDLNFGCPAPTVNRHRGGAVLLKEPEVLHAIVSAVRAAVPASTPVTAKMRLGYEDTSLTLACAQAIASAGADELTVHARTKVEGYKPPAHWEWLARIRESVAIPVVANGEVWTVADYRTIREVSGCETVMIGRGLVSAPDLALRIKHMQQHGEELPPMPWLQLLPWLLDMASQCQQRAENGNYALSRIKQWLKMLRRNYVEADEMFSKIKELKKFDELASAIKQASAQG